MLIANNAIYARGSAIRLINGDEEIILTEFASIIVGEGELKLIDQLGKIRKIAGRITEIDLMNQRVLVG